MKLNKAFLVSILILVLAAAACNLPARDRAEITPPPAPAAEGEPPVAENCASPVPPGIWTGSAQLASSASRMGLTVIEQEAALPLNLLVECDGAVSGSASRSGQASISVPLALNGACTDSVQYDVRGSISGTEQNLVLDLVLTAREGGMACDVNSRISSIPSGPQQVNVAGQEEQLRLSGISPRADRIEGRDWPDRFYRVQLPNLDELIVEYELDVEEQGAWSLNWQSEP
jgi:hypothetical protein